MPDTVHHVMWYTVYDVKTGDLIATDTPQKKEEPAGAPTPTGCKG